MKVVLFAILLASVSIHVLSQNPYYSKYWYGSDCCPTLRFGKSLVDIKKHPIYDNYYAYVAGRCYCTHTVIALDCCRSMTAPGYSLGKSILDAWGSFLNILDNPTGTPIYHFLSYYTFSSTASIPYFLHIHPFYSPPDPAVTGKPSDYVPVSNCPPNDFPPGPSTTSLTNALNRAT